MAPPVICTFVQAIAQLYGHILGQDQQTRFTVFITTSIGVLVVLPQHSEKAKAAREKLQRSTAEQTQPQGSTPAPAATKKLVRFSPQLPVTKSRCSVRWTWSDKLRWHYTGKKGRTKY